MVNLQKYDVVILCGGMGKRLRRTVGSSQKVMASVGGYPFLDILLHFIWAAGFRRVILCTGYKAKNIEAYYNKQNGHLTFVFSREKKPLGTAGAIRLAQKYIHSQLFFVLNGDSFCPIDFRKFLLFHQKKKAIASVVVSKVKSSQDYGSILMDKNHRITGFREKMANPRTAFVNAGIYCFKKEVLKSIPQKKYVMLEKDVFPKWVKKAFYGFVTKRSFVDIGTPKRYAQAQRLLRRQPR